MDTSILISWITLLMNVTMQVLCVTYLMYCVTLTVASSRTKALTFNTGLIDTSLIPGVIPNNRVERRDAIIDELQRSDYDLVCLQEVWFGKDTEAIVDGLFNKFRYSYSALHKKDGTLPPQANTMHEPVCNIARMLKLAQCIAINQCNLITIEAAAGCVLTNCLEEYRLLFTLDGQQCISCISFADPAKVVQTCTAAEPASLGNMNDPGLLLLSKRPLTNKAHVDYFPKTTEIINRGYLAATIDGKTTAVCTHLSAQLPFYPELELASLGFTSYLDQHKHEVNILVKRLSDVTKLILMGDFNTGGAGKTGNLDEIIVEEYNILKAAFRTQSVERCTFCDDSENIYNSDKGIIENSAIDHFFFGKQTKFWNVERVFDQLVVPDGSGNQLTMSDHFGVTVEFAPSCSGRKGNGRKYRRPYHIS